MGFADQIKRFRAPHQGKGARRAKAYDLEPFRPGKAQCGRGETLRRPRGPTAVAGTFPKKIGQGEGNRTLSYKSKRGGTSERGVQQPKNQKRGGGFLPERSSIYYSLGTKSWGRGGGWWKRSIKCSFGEGRGEVAR